MASTIQPFLSTNSVDYRRPTTVISFPLNGSENEFAFEADKPEYKLHVLQWCRYICICATPANAGKLKQAQLIRTNPRNTLRGQSRSLNMVPFDMLGMHSCASKFVPKIRRFSDIWLQKMSWSWNPGQRSLKVIESVPFDRLGMVSY